MSYWIIESTVRPKKYFDQMYGAGFVPVVESKWRVGSRQLKAIWPKSIQIKDGCFSRSSGWLRILDSARRMFPCSAIRLVGWGIWMVLTSFDYKNWDPKNPRIGVIEDLHLSHKKSKWTTKIWSWPLKHQTCTIPKHEIFDRLASCFPYLVVFCGDVRGLQWRRLVGRESWALEE